MKNLPPLDPDGHLLHQQDWNKETAEQLAHLEQITLTAAHWDIINLARAFYQDFGLPPRQRPLVRYVKDRLGAERGNSIYLMTLFPGSPARLISRIAGLPCPSSCF
ncbi:MAG: TusE/DsrC/DsvC family sulfur relay protein [Kistimonas sp.]|nr:TusE/DsrC/DsvC family sulfur relay protein [Kistimonas sp.]